MPPSESVVSSAVSVFDRWLHSAAPSMLPACLYDLTP